MKTAWFGRLLFGMSAVLFGIIALRWHDAQTWQYLRKFWSLPYGTILGDVLMVALIACGIGIVFARTARPAAFVLGILFALFSLTCVPGIVAAPNVYGEYGSFFEQFSLLSGALAVYAAMQTDAARCAVLGRVARLGMGLSAVSFTLAQAFYLQLTADLVPKWIPPGQMFWAIVTTVAFALAASAMLVNWKARLALRLMTLMLALFGILVWIPLLVAHPEAHVNWSEFTLTMLITGAAWSVSDVPYL